MAEKPDPFKVFEDAASSGQRFSRGVMDSAQQIWLAGLGALSRTQQEGGKYFDALVEEGVRIQQKTKAYTEEQLKQIRDQAEPWMDAAQKRTNAAMEKFGHSFEDGMAQVMKRMKLPTADDIARLSARVDALERAAHKGDAGAAGPKKSAKPKS